MASNSKSQPFVKSARLRGVQVKNYMRIRGVDLDFGDEGAVYISGRNRQGKSTLVDAIWAALTGTREPEPVRTGSSSASLTVRLEITGTDRTEYVFVHRTIVDTEGGPSYKLKVTTESGLPFPRPQEFLGQLWNAISFDPHEWARMGLRGTAGRREQARDLIRIAGVSIPDALREIAARYHIPPWEPSFDPLEAFDIVDQKVRDHRRDRNRELARNTAELAAFGDLLTIHHVERVDVKAVQRRQTDLRYEQTKKRTAKDAIAAVERDLTHVEADIIECELELGRMREKRAALGLELSARKEALALMPEPQDPDELNLDILKATETNALADRLDAKIAKQAIIVALTEETDELTGVLDMVADLSSELLAGANLPDGLSYDMESGGLVHNGARFPDSCSEAEQVEVGIKVGLMSKPALKLMHIKLGSVLDTEARAALERAAEEHDCLVFIELVDETGTEGIVIEDGAVVADNRGAIRPL